jgi:hypothetical protein
MAMGTVDVLDVQRSINHRLGNGTSDLEGHGICNVSDIQRVINKPKALIAVAEASPEAEPIYMTSSVKTGFSRAIGERVLVSRILASEQTDQFRDRIAAKKAQTPDQPNAQARRLQSMETKYPRWQSALGVGCEALFSLNRYTKHESCTRAHRDEIYRLKNRMVELLYHEGYSTQCYLHHQPIPAQECFGCDGTGDHYGDMCYRCGGTGEWRPATTFTFVCFRFGVEGTSYCWHQPKTFVTFKYETTAEPSEWKPDQDKEEQEVPLSPSKFAEAKDLLRWILAKSAQETVTPLITNTGENT